jgi:hypothetical protein
MPNKKIGRYVAIGGIALVGLLYINVTIAAHAAVLFCATPF